MTAVPKPTMIVLPSISSSPTPNPIVTLQIKPIVYPHNIPTVHKSSYEGDLLDMENLNKTEERFTEKKYKNLNINSNFHNAGKEENLIIYKNLDTLTEVKIINNTENIEISKTSDTTEKYKKYCWIWILIAFIIGCFTRFIGRKNKDENNEDINLETQANNLKKSLE
ncbi:TPA: hypothetical protein EYP45_03465 [Candidatus Peregrinibacteria bacterium]|nr:hypothetical protein [Candidatus Peregrinibacteria bacterium]